MSKQRLEELDKLVDEILIFTNIDVKSPYSCNKFIKEHNLDHVEEDYVYFRLRSKATKAFKEQIVILMANIINGVWDGY